jgi:glycosyltransferase involved in cell wall biosynthesis
VVVPTYQEICRFAERGEFAEARRGYEQMVSAEDDLRAKALIRNDLAVLDAVGGDPSAALAGFEAALAIDATCEPARLNRDLVKADFPELAGLPDPVVMPPLVDPVPAGPVKVALVSFLFNWPSTGGGIIHTVELAQFLAKAGYEVRHFYARHEPWGIGRVERPLPFPSEVLEFEPAGWTVPAIQARFRQAVDAFRPDYVIITDSWNMKPLLAEAMSGYPYLLRFQAMECLCPLNNVRLLPEADGRFRQCPLNQLAHPRECCQCLWERGRFSGSLHQAERALCGVGSQEYYGQLLQALWQAEAVLVVNPRTAEMLQAFTACVRVVTAGMDPARFPWPWPEAPEDTTGPRPKRVFFAGLVDEPMKGFGVLHEACARLWQRRQDFELVATGEPAEQVDPFTRFVGWLSQEELPRHLRAAAMLAMPTVAQEALGRTAVEALGVGRPVVASRIGGLPDTVVDGETGLLCEPGDADDLARKIEALLDDVGLRERLGQAGRRRFEEHYTWDVIVEKHYRPLLRRRQKKLV